jgi:hypothetical protein
MTTTPTTGSMGKGFIQCVLIGILFVFVGVYSKYSNHTSPPPPARSQASPVALVPRPCQQGSWSNKTFEIPMNGGLSEYLCKGWQDFPLGGEIAIVTPNGKVIHDKPGAIINDSSPEGIYFFRVDGPPGPRQVTIYNRWQ